MSIHPEATIDPRADLHDSVVVWAGTRVRENARVGQGTSLGQSVYVGPGAVIGRDCKIQNGAMIYEPAVIGDGVFVGPGVVLTNDKFPRAIKPDGTPKSPDDWEAVGVTVEYGASIGAAAVCVAPLSIGTWATVAAGAVVVADVAPYALVAGVPARRIAWVGRAGHVLERHSGGWRCPVTGDRFIENSDGTSLAVVAP